jgi:hypothetical protein
MGHAAATNVPSPASATISISGRIVAAGVGYKWGRGVITFHGEPHRFCVRGLSIGDVGVAVLSTHGSVFHLKSLDQFPGRYFAISAGAGLAVGKTAALLKNARGVVIALETKVIGVRYSIAASGLSVEMANSSRCMASHPSRPH